MEVLNKQVLDAFVVRHRSCERALETWLEVAADSSWSSPHDIKARFASASFVAGNRVVFNIKGNRYRLVVQVDYEGGVVYVLWVGTHARYDRIDVESL